VQKVNDTTSSEDEQGYDSEYDSEEENSHKKKKRHSTAEDTDSNDEGLEALEDSRALKNFYRQKANQMGQERQQ
jgi:hypothetical protein